VFYIFISYFDDPTKLFSDLYLAKFLDTLAKLFFPCNQNLIIISYTPRLRSTSVKYRIAR